MGEASATAGRSRNGARTTALGTPPPTIHRIQSLVNYSKRSKSLIRGIGTRERRNPKLKYTQAF